MDSLRGSHKGWVQNLRGFVCVFLDLPNAAGMWVAGSTPS